VRNVRGRAMGTTRADHVRAHAGERLPGVSESHDASLKDALGSGEHGVAAREELLAQREESVGRREEALRVREAGALSGRESTCLMATSAQRNTTCRYQESPGTISRYAERLEHALPGRPIEHSASAPAGTVR